MSEKEKIEFEFSWKALHLLGKSLYSNAWSAISELVANGFDAKADNVYVLIDARKKDCSTVEILDDGKGMDDVDIETYVKVGYDRREEAYGNNDTPSTDIMGRKGIGKLAALFLSDDYYIQTKTEESCSTWNLAFRDSDYINDTPHLTRVENNQIQSQIPFWDETATGTLLVLNKVNLSGLGDVAFESLSIKLANQFLLSSLSGKKIYLAVMIKESDVKPSFIPVEKSIAYRNLAFIAKNYPSTNAIPEDISAIESNPAYVKIPFQKVKDRHYEHRIEVDELASVQDDKMAISGAYSIDASLLDEDKLKLRTDITFSEDQKTAYIPYELTGWIGFHATINESAAKENDDRFRKNPFYNPAQIRLYVRNKLASENVLEKLGITQAFINYVEGEISFDLLDDDILPDIATSSRQGFDELDQRWDTLQKILRPIVRTLITRRNNLTKKIKAKEDGITTNRETAAKTEAINSFKDEIEDMPELGDGQRMFLTDAYASKLRGSVDLKAKANFIIFLSHQSRDKAFSDFIYNLLKHRGAIKEDFFYTSADDNPGKYESIQPLQDQIRRNIISDNTLIAYFTSANFRESEYCLFEAGAGWATRGIGQYQLLSTAYEDIPDYLTNSKSERCLNISGSIALDRDSYALLVPFLNNLINHINKSRIILGDEVIDVFPDPKFPDKVEMEKMDKVDRDFMDDEIVTYWEKYIEASLAAYESALKQTRDNRRKTQTNSAAS